MHRSTFVLLFIASTATAQAPSDPVVAGDFGTRADSVVRAVEAHGFSGVVRIVRAGTTHLYKGYGLANRREAILFTTQTVVQIGSNTKDFTAVAILQLQDRGLLNVRDTIGKYFSDAPVDKRGIRILQVLNHRAGLPDFVSPLPANDADFEPVGREEFLKRLFAAPLIDKPGADEHYSNAGYSLLAALIERLTRSSYDAFVNDNICKPLGLINTGFAIPTFDQRRLSHGYRNGTDIGTILGHSHPPDGPYWNLRGNGGMSSTLDEMHTFYDALFVSNRLLKPATRDIMFSPDEPVGLAGSDGVSVFVYERYPRLGVEVIIASNNSESRAVPLRRALAKALGLPEDQAPAL